MRTKLFRSFALLFLIISGLSQAQQKNQIRFSYNFFVEDQPIFLNTEDGGDGYHIGSPIAFDLHYLRELEKNFFIETGIDYLGKRIITSHTNIPRQIPKIDDIKEDFHLLSIPVYARYHFGKYFFASGGALLEAQLNRTTAPNQSGLGLGATAGAQYSYSNFIFSVNPSAKLHGLLSGKSLFAFTIQAGVGYKF
ncbi:hypothetical protein ACQ1PL_08970 [Ornithobacterium rhinotracheale]